MTLEKGKGEGRYSKYFPYAFIEQDVSMLSTELNSEKAIEVNIAIIRTFILIRQQITGFEELSKKIKQVEKKYNKNFKEVLAALDFLKAKK